MAQVEIEADDVRAFEAAAAAAGTDVGRWLAAAGRAWLGADGDSGGDGGSGGGVELGALWRDVLDDLADGGLSGRQLEFLRAAQPFALVEDTLLLRVPDVMSLRIIDTSFRLMAALHVERRLGRPVQLALSVGEPPRAAVRGELGLVRRYERLIARPEVTRALAEVLARADGMPPR
ncbi:hypothetical protein [Symbioplanes lichenis]|uniref:hypothetical protein n=1 Tax=Symbioplanes lichenis TaxID=1629072 RepID=UPI002739CBA2|nr:hypothetical protein [Actinoplanes lichenis]